MKLKKRVVIIGLGYVGLPLLCVIHDAGFDARGIDIDVELIARISRGECPIINEPGLPELLRPGLATTSYAVCEDADIFVIAVETPIDDDKRPDYRALNSVLESIGPHIRPGALVIIESTLAPGTMDGIVRPILESKTGFRAGSDFYLVHCPERIMPGKLLSNLRNCSRVVGAVTSAGGERAAQFYKHFVEGDLDVTGCLTAELVKTMENTYRDVQIALANEMALLCEDLGADVWRVRELVNKCPGRNMHLPGAGVGGHCIPKDPWLLVANAPRNTSLVSASRAVNDWMPVHMALMTICALEESNISDARVAVLGYAYRENSDDIRNSPSAALVELLERVCSSISIHDPHVDRFSGDVRDIVSGHDAIVVMVAHDEYKSLDLNALHTRVRNPVLIDGRHIFTPEQAQSAGWIYRCVGIGK